MDRLAPLRRNRFVVLGRAGMDLYADPPGTLIETATRFTAALGGSSANIAVALARQGAAAALVTCVSDDAVGRFCRSELMRHGVDTRCVAAALIARPLAATMPPVAAARCAPSRPTTSFEQGAMNSSTQMDMLPINATCSCDVCKLSTNST